MSRRNRIALVILVVMVALFSCEVATHPNRFRKPPPAPASTPPPASPTGVRAAP